MATVPALEKPRLELRLRADESFDRDLGLFGQNVGPRLGPEKRTQSEKEDWCMRRLLIAWRSVVPERFPLEVTAYPSSKENRLPDFAIGFSDDGRLGVEVTEATSKSFQKELTGSEKSGSEFVAVESPGGYGFAGDAPERMLVNDISRAIERKARRAAKRRYDHVPRCDLLIYENSKGSILAPDRDAVWRMLGEHWRDQPQPFRQVHLLWNGYVRVDILGHPQDVSIHGLYEHDFVEWLEAQAGAAREGRRAALDLANIAEELECLARTERRSFRSHLRNLLAHLLKWEHQPARRSTSWRRSIDNSRRALEDHLADSPSLGAEEFLSEALSREYPRARTRAIQEARIAADAVPEQCPYGWDLLLDPDHPPTDNPPAEG